jgi:hypothetical protein
MLVYFITTKNVLLPFDIFMAVWYRLLSFGTFFPVLECLDKEKSGNPGKSDVLDQKKAFKTFRKRKSIGNRSLAQIKILCSPFWFRRATSF